MDWEKALTSPLFYWFVIIFFTLINCYVTSMIGKGKGYKPLLSALWGLLSIPGFIVVTAIPKKSHIIELDKQLKNNNRMFLEKQITEEQYIETKKSIKSQKPKVSYFLVNFLIAFYAIGIFIIARSMLSVMFSAKENLINNANTNAKRAMNATNQVLCDLHEYYAYEVTIEGWQDYNINGKTTGNEQWNLICSYLPLTTADGDKENLHFSVYIKNGAAVMAVAKVGKVYGTYPPVLTDDNYKEKLGKSPTLKDAKELAKEKYNSEHYDKIP